MPKAEFPPLLRPGLHEFDLTALETLCVSRFPISTTRQPLWEGLQQFLWFFSINNLKTELWINGSYLTEKINPEDCDLVATVDGERLDYDPPYHDAIMEITNSQADVWSKIRCHVFFRPVWPADHPQYQLGEAARKRWRKTFGRSLVKRTPKRPVIFYPFCKTL